MTGPTEDNEGDVLEEAVQQFIDAQLAGQAPDLEEFVKDYPGLQDQIGERVQNLREIDDLFSSLMETEDSDFGDSTVGHELIGQKLGNFEILDLIGTGGMGAVFLARQVSLGREVALKVISDVRGVHNTSLERFKREAKVLAQISHSNSCFLLPSTKPAFRRRDDSKKNSILQSVSMPGSILVIRVLVKVG